MPKAHKENAGIRHLLRYYREVFRTPENVNHYSAKDYKMAEKKFLKYAVLGRGAGGQKNAP
jgi:hypothetical protein